MKYHPEYEYIALLISNGTLCTLFFLVFAHVSVAVKSHLTFTYQLGISPMQSDLAFHGWFSELVRWIWPFLILLHAIPY
jgi:hypothetical protein